MDSQLGSALDTLDSHGWMVTTWALFLEKEVVEFSRENEEAYWNNSSPPCFFEDALELSSTPFPWGKKVLVTIELVGIKSNKDGGPVYKSWGFWIHDLTSNP